ncbi:MAG: O-acetylhomoserine aminocarboxypropyltransferase/cysteine synthase [Clostridiales bacterium]|jgi:O-acetylhomoserine (thiol)-lyase|nr:O-acetylhomoserine aminocarboxypropyltransferase/cysteine synthase [Clostridiales bacterium]
MKQNRYNIRTKCVQSGYRPQNGEANTPPVVMSTTFKYDSTEHVGALFDLKESGYFYTRLANPSAGWFEEKLCDLEGGVGAVMTASGQSATLFSVLNIASAGDNVVCTTDLYGGTVNLLAVTMKRMGIGMTFFKPDDFSGIEGAINDRTRAVFGESLANPALSVLDIEQVAKIAHKRRVPLIVDNTFPTPYLLRPIEWGADIVIHSTSKYIDGHAVALGGAVVDSGNFDWEKSGRFPELVVPDESYHGTSYTRDFGKSAYIVKLRAQLMRDIGAAPSAMNAFLAHMGLETLHLRMERHSENALAAARFLQGHKKVKSVTYPGLEGDKYYGLCQKYMDGKGSGVVSFELHSYADAVKLMDALRLARIVVHVADVRTGVLHPASATHRQLNAAQLVEAGISEGTIRLSVGIEDSADIIADLKQGLDRL